MKNMTEQITMRLPKETVKHLDEMSNLMNLKRSEWVQLKIETEYDTLKGNPKIKAFLEEMQKIGNNLRKVIEPDKDVPDCDGLSIETAPHPDPEPDGRE